MTKDEYLAKLNEAFHDFKFFPDDHHYEYKGKRVGVSVTRLIEEYVQPFDAETIAQRVANKSGKSVQEVLDEWEYKNKFSCEKGSTCHEFAQSLWNNQPTKFNHFDFSDEWYWATSKIQRQARNFYDDYKDKLEHLADEFVIGSEEYDIASAIDHLFINKLTGGLVLVDYKTNSDIHKNEKYAGKMKAPLGHLKDTTLNHYYIQLSIYKYLVEKYAGIKVDEMFIVYMSENIENYEIIDVPYLKKEVEKILNLRRRKKMGRMILLMGEPASGKTVSLRNIPRNELYYIDADKKGLNYKGWKNDFNEEKKNYFRSNDEQQIKAVMDGVNKQRPDIHYLVIDTINSVMIADEMRRMKGKNYNEWQDLAKCIFEMIDDSCDFRDDLNIIFIGHTQTDDEGFVRLLTNGRKLNKIGLEKYFDVVLIAKNIDNKYVLETTSPKSTARVPMGCFEGQQYIENDIMKVFEELQEF